MAREIEPAVVNAGANPDDTSTMLSGLDRSFRGKLAWSF
jgi:hypothetical protein